MQKGLLREALFLWGGGRVVELGKVTEINIISPYFPLFPLIFPHSAHQQEGPHHRSELELSSSWADQHRKYLPLSGLPL